MASVSTSKEHSVDFGQDLTYVSDEEKEGAEPAKKRKKWP